LDEFTQRRPGVRLELRIKAVNEPGGLLESLTTTSAAAPQILPDLVALPRPILETAAAKGVLHPLDGLTNLLDDEDWFEYSRNLASVQNNNFGFPFAGDALIMVYREEIVKQVPLDFASALTSTYTLAFPASDPQALFPLALYLSAGGEIQNAQGQPSLNAEILKDVLAFLHEAQYSGFTPYWLTQYKSDQEVWQALLEKRCELIITWVSRYLNKSPTNAVATIIPTPRGSAFTLANGWIWASASHHPENLALSIELAEYLSDSDFLAKWIEALGYLPTRPSALGAWQDASVQMLLNQVASSAYLFPSSEILAIITPPISQATIQVLKEQKDPYSAAQEAVEALAKP